MGHRTMLVLKSCVVLEAREVASRVRAHAAQGQAWYSCLNRALGCSDIALKRSLRIMMQAHNRHFTPILHASQVTLNPSHPHQAWDLAQDWLFSIQPNLPLLLLGLNSLQDTCVGTFRGNYGVGQASGWENGDLEPSCVAGGNIKWCSVCGRQFGSISKDKQASHMIRQIHF